MLKETELKFKYSYVTPTGKALKAPANLLKWCSVANSNEGTVRKKELLQGLPTNETGLPLCEAATKHCPHTDQHSSTHLQASVSPWEPDTALFMSVSATGASMTLMPSEELPAWKNRKGKTDKVSALFPSQLPSKNRMMCPCRKILLQLKNSLVSWTSELLECFTKDHTALKPAFNGYSSTH